MKVFDLYGLAIKDGGEAARFVTRQLGIELHPRVSSYCWGDYLTSGLDDEFRVMPNFLDGDWTQEEFQHCTWLLEVNDNADADGILARLTRLDGVAFIHRTEMEVGMWVKKYAYRNGQFELIEVHHFSE
jgi:hypothetical protein